MQMDVPNDTVVVRKLWPGSFYVGVGSICLTVGYDWCALLNVCRKVVYVVSYLAG